MPTPLLASKLYVPPARARIVHRARLTARLDDGIGRHQFAGCRLTLISAAAGFGKTTLISEWAARSAWPVAWLSLDEGDNDPVQFLAYFITALQTVVPLVGEGALAALQSPQPPPPAAILAAVLNEIGALPDPFVLVLDDYHTIDAKPVDEAVAFLLQHMPAQMHLIIATREDPQLPLARLRARDRLTELRAADLRFTAAETAQFLNQVMDLNLSPAELASLETRTEGWIAGLHLAALSMQGHAETAAFIETFGGSNRFVLDYLMEEVLQQQPVAVQDFLLQTAILNRLCGPLCDAILQDDAASGQKTLDYLERANLFLIPLDDERRWYRYHHLFAELLRQRLLQQRPDRSAALHIRASAWYEANGFELEAFQHAAAAHDIDRAERLLEGKGMPLLFRGAVRPVLQWLDSLPRSALDAHPSLWVTYGSALLFVSQTTGVEEKLRAAEAALQGSEPDEKLRDLIGHIASIRATLAVTRHDVETIIAQSRRALEYLHPQNAPVRAATTWTLGYAYRLKGERMAAGRAFVEARTASQAIGHSIITLMATLGLGNLQEEENQLRPAEETYRHVLELAGSPPLPVACEAHLGLARINYMWNDLESAQLHGRQALELAHQISNTDRAVATELFLARLTLARGDAVGATALVAQAAQTAHHHNFVQQLPEVAAVQVLIYLHQGNLTAAGQWAEAHDIPLSQARVQLASGATGAALDTLAAYRQKAEARGWADEQLRTITLQALAARANGDRHGAARLLVHALAMAEPGGFIRIFVDEGTAMAQLLGETAVRQASPDYAARLLAAFDARDPRGSHMADTAGRAAQPLIEPLSERELEVLRLMARGLSNREIGELLFLAEDTVKGHNRRIFGKLQVRRRTEAVAKARSLRILPLDE